MVREDRLQRDMQKSAYVYASPLFPTLFCFPLGPVGQPTTHSVAERGQKFVFISTGPSVIDRKGSGGAKQD